MIIHILSGPVRSGKTSRLLLWIYHRSDVDGILAPVFNNQRYLLNIPAKTARLLDAAPKETLVVTVGNHRFAQRTFDWGNQVLQKALAASRRWLVVDEIGLLELQGKGLDAAVQNILRRGTNTGQRHLVLVVRENLRQAVIAHYNLNETTIRDFDFPEDEG